MNPESSRCEGFSCFAFHPSGMEVRFSLWVCLAGSSLSPGSDPWGGVAAAGRTGDGYARSNIFSHKRGKTFLMTNI